MRLVIMMLAVLGLCATAWADSELEKPVAILAGEKPIDVQVGHAAPFMADLDGDGVRDLLVGQMGKGHLRVYKNVGSNSAPKFAEFALFRAAGEDATVPTG